MAAVARLTHGPIDFCVLSLGPALQTLGMGSVLISFGFHWLWTRTIIREHVDDA